MSTLKFKTVTGEEFGNVTKSQNTQINIKVVTFKLKRPSSGCNRGFGFCDFEWFPSYTDFALSTSGIDEDRHSFVIKSTEDGEQFVELALIERPENLNSNRMKALIVEEALKSSALENGVKKSLTVPAGSYHFSDSVGEFGGYKVLLKE